MRKLGIQPHIPGSKLDMNPRELADFAPDMDTHELAVAASGMSTHELVAAMTLEEKTSLLSGSDYWHTKAIGRLGIDTIMVADGPHGLRKQDGHVDHVGLAVSVPATCFPPACATGSSFDTALLAEIGEAIGEEACDQGVSVVLGPGVNIKRSPLCGRNFEYFSEDPYLSGKLAAAWIEGVQSKGVGASLKHFAANSQEYFRMISNSIIDERTLREIYLAAFEIAIKQVQPWTVMCSYNRINGVYASDNRRLLTDILRNDWGFEGLVVSDWGAVNSRVAGVAAGLDLEMPFSGGSNDRQIASAVREGLLDEAEVDRACERVLTLVRKGMESRRTAPASASGSASAPASASVSAPASGLAPAFAPGSASVSAPAFASTPTSASASTPAPGLASDSAPAFASTSTCDYHAHHLLARRAASESCVLLKNEGPILPLDKQRTYAVIGAFAKEPRYQGTGSSKVNPWQLDDAFSELQAAGLDVSYEPGYSLEMFAPPDEALIENAIALAKTRDVALVFAGLPSELEGEGLDRSFLEMPDSHVRLIEAVAAANPHTVVILSLGSPVVTPWAKDVQGIVVGYLGGQAGGGGLADVLSGVVCPSGRLAETWSCSLADTPADLWYPRVRSGMLVGEGKGAGRGKGTERDKGAGFDESTEHGKGTGRGQGAGSENDSGYYNAAGRDAQYRESVFVGYRYYDTAAIEPAWPFGYGLSYTSFAYSDLTLSAREYTGGELTVSLSLTNTGTCAGAEVVQLYVGYDADATCNSMVFRPQKELKGFEKVFLKPGECRRVVIRLDERAFSYYNTPYHCWAREQGDYRISVGASSRDIRLSSTVSVVGDGLEEALCDLKLRAPTYYDLSPFRSDEGVALGIPDEQFSVLLRYPLPQESDKSEGERERESEGNRRDVKGIGKSKRGKDNCRGKNHMYDHNTVLADIRHKLIGRILISQMRAQVRDMLEGQDMGGTIDPVVFETPLRCMMMMSGGSFSASMMNALIDLLNGRYVSGVRGLLRKDT